MKIKETDVVLIASLLFFGIGLLLMEPTKYGYYHPLLSDGFVILTLWFIGRDM